MRRDVCILCNHELPIPVEPLVRRDLDREACPWRYECPRCGSYVIDQELRWDIAALAGWLDSDGKGTIAKDQVRERTGDLFDQRHLLSGWARQALVEGREPPRFDAETARSILSVVPRDMPEKVDRLLLNIAEMSGEHGAAVHNVSYADDYTLGYCNGMDELLYQLRYLEQKGLITDPAYAMNSARACVSVLGWEYVRELRQTSSHADRCFVAMDFDDSMQEVFDKAIEPAVKAAGYRPIRIDRKEHVGRIDDEIIVELNRSRFVVADFTNHRHGVYFEAGYGLGRGIPVIWTCRKDQMSQAHFDTEHYNHIVWNDIAELREKLELRIRAVIGGGQAISDAD